MIFYFSGTGNSRGIAEMIAEKLQDTTVDIVGKNPDTFRLEKEAYIGFVFPVYAWAAPEVMLDFVKKLAEKMKREGTFEEKGYSFAIATYSNVAGKAIEQFSNIFSLQSGFGITMPDNYPITERILDTPESTLEKLSAAKIRLEKIIQCIQRQEKVVEVKEGEDAVDNTYVKAHIFNEKMRKTAPYHVTEKCIGCGICEKICPANAIRMEAGKPVWYKKDCYFCMACLNRCPKEAIEYGKYSSGRPRYYFRGFSEENYKEYYDKYRKENEENKS